MPESFRICPICEAACGLKLTTNGRTVERIEANAEDLFSTGHVCAKGLSLKELENDPDRIRTPLIKEGSGFRPATWDEAFAVVNERLNGVIDQYGPGAVATYTGNPSAHNIGLAMGLGAFSSTLQTQHSYSAGTVDQIPKHLASELMFGNPMAVPVPDIARSSFLLMLGANPIVSNGSLWMVPDFRGKLRDFKDRGGQFVTVDPRRTETARLADEHVFIRPGGDAWLLIALINELNRLGLCIPSRYSVEGDDLLIARLSAISLDDAATACGVAEEQIIKLAAQLHEATRPVVYGRVGTTLQRHGTLTSFLIEVINLMTGSLDVAGGAMFPEQPFSTPFDGASGLYDGFRSRVSGYPSFLNQLPVAAFAEEMEVPGEGQIKALVCIAGNPVVSNPDSDRLARSIERLDFSLCIDIYHNETSRLADVILPGTSPFEDSHYDHFLGMMGHRNVARYSPAVFASDRPDEWQMMLTLAFILGEKRLPDDTELAAFEDVVISGFVSAFSADETSSLRRRDVQEIMAMIEPNSGVERMLDVGIRAGRFGDHFGQRDGLTLRQMRESVNGIDLGPIREGRLHEVVNGSINLAPPLLLDDIDALQQAERGRGLLLIGRRNTRSNNSWLRNLPMLGKGRDLCVLEVHPQDAAALGIGDGETALLSSDNASLEIPVHLTEDLLPGVVAMPHGFSSDGELQQAHCQNGENYNRLVPAAIIDRPSATSALNGITVRVSRTRSNQDAW